MAGALSARWQCCVPGPRHCQTPPLLAGFRHSERTCTHPQRWNLKVFFCACSGGWGGLSALEGGSPGGVGGGGPPFGVRSLGGFVDLGP